ncbi:MAG: GGDEF domain-containing protein [Agathobacter sp.]
MRKSLLITNLTCLLMSILLLIPAFVIGKSHIYQGTETGQTSELVPSTVEQVSEDVRAFYFEPENIAPGDVLEFYTNHEEVWAYVGDELIYSLEHTDSIYGKTTGSVYNFINLPTDATQLKVVIQAIYPEKRDSKLQFYMGNGRVLYENMVKSSAPGAIICILCMALGITLTAYYMISKRRSQTNLSIIYFGLFATLISAWAGSKTQLATLIIGNQAAVSFAGYVLLMLVVPPFVLFFREFMEVDEHISSTILCIASSLNFFINTIGHMAGLWYFKKSAIFIHLLLICGVIYMVYAIFWHIRHIGMDRKAITNLIGAVILSLSLMVDMFSFYDNGLQTDILGKFGIMLYLILLGSECMYEFNLQQEAGRKAEIYKELAVTDTLTGLHNRNAFDEWEHTNTNFENTMLVTFDLNNLKWCNDTLGHAAGDKYLVDAAEIIRHIFGKLGVCYRIGGDEFCVVIKNADTVDIDQLYKTFSKKQELYNEQSKDIVMRIACGHATFGERDATIEETRSRADMRMYQHKKSLKNGQ